MSVGPVNISSVTGRVETAPPAGAAGSSVAVGQSFTAALQGAREEDRSQLREAAEKLVTDAFVKPALAAMRESPFLNDGPFAPGPGERRFMPMLDELIADRITKAANFPLVDAVTEHISNLVGFKPSQVPATSMQREVRHG